MILNLRMELKYFVKLMAMNRLASERSGRSEGVFELNLNNKTT